MPTEEQLAELRERITATEESITIARQELKLAERAGADVQPQVTRLQEQVDKLKRIKVAYSL